MSHSMISSYFCCTLVKLTLNQTFLIASCASNFIQKNKVYSIKIKYAIFLFLYFFLFLLN